MASALLLLLCVVLAVEPGEAVWAARRRPVWLACPGEDGVVSEWLQHDRPLLLPDTRRRLLPNGTLHFTKVVAKSDTGLYRCVRRSSTGPVVSVAVRLQMAGVAHDFTEAPSNVTALAGEVVRMSCQIDSMPKATISWERDGKPLPPDTRYVTSVQGVLYIADTEASDEGDYRCVATNVVIGKKRVSSIGHLSVDLAKQSTAAPQLLPTADVVNASEGDDVALVCAARGLPQPVVRWLAPGTRATLSEARGLALLVLHDVSSVHVGEYVCEDADSQERQTVMLAVWTTPHVYLKQPKQSIPAAKTVRFSCEVSGEPKPELFWFKDGRRLHINGRMKQRGTELVMTTTLSSDSGLYQCVASNVAGEAWAVGQLLVSSPSRLEPPRGLSCHPTPAGPVEVSWDSPPGQNFTAFTVHYLPTEGGEETQQVTVNRTVLISDLQPFTNYTFYIRVYFQRSASEESERVTCHTAEGVPIGAPEVQAEVESATTVKLRWSPPPARLARGRISAYKLQWGPRGAPAYHVEEFPSTVTTHVLTGLEPGATYQVRVLASTSRGYPTLQLPWITVEIPGGVLGSNLDGVNVTVTRVNNTTLQVIWLLPNTTEGSAVQLWYRPRGGAEVGPLEFAANETRALLTGLVDGPVYEVRVAVEGLTGSAVLVPHSVVATPISPHSLRVSWAMSTGDSSYRITVTPLGDHTAQPLSLVSSEPEVVVDGLQPNTLYEVKVRSESAGDPRGMYGQTLEVRTPEDVPGHVRDVRWEPVNQTTVHVSWHPPVGLVRRYIVRLVDATGVTAPHSVAVPATKLSAEVSGLVADTLYHLTVAAENGAGVSSPSAMQPVVVRASPGPVPTAPSPVTPSDDGHLGVAVGVAVGLSCVLLCFAVAMLWRRRRQRQLVAGGQRRQWELEMLGGSPNIPPPDGPRHLDTKGGYPNNHTNGVKCVPLLSNGRISNGSVHITENPQYKLQPGESDQPLLQHAAAAAARVTGMDASTQMTLLYSTTAAE